MVSDQVSSQPNMELQHAKLGINVFSYRNYSCIAGLYRHSRCRY